MLQYLYRFIIFLIASSFSHSYSTAGTVLRMRGCCDAIGCASNADPAAAVRPREEEGAALLSTEVISAPAFMM